MYDVGWLDWLESSLAGRSSKEVFVENLREALAKRGDARRLADDLGVTEATISKWKAGKSEPTFDDIDKLSLVLGKTPFTWLVDHSESKKSEPSPPSVQERIRMLETALKMVTRHLDELKSALKSDTASAGRSRRDGA